MDKVAYVEYDAVTGHFWIRRGRDSFRYTPSARWLDYIMYQIVCPRGWRVQPMCRGWIASER